MPQKFGLYEDLSLRENMDLFADLQGLEQRPERYGRLLAISGLAPFAERLAGKLSGGMKQKLGLICTLLASPTLLLLDEPTVGVDPLSRLELWDIISGLARQEQASIIVSTSYMDEAAQCDQVVLLHEGKVLSKGAPAEIRRKSAGMAFLARPAAHESARSLQARLLNVPGIIDALPQSGGVRLVHDKLPEAQRMQLKHILNEAPPRPLESSLEDSFMLLLHKPPPAARPGPAAPPCLWQTPAPEKRPIIETRHVSRFFGDFVAVNDVSFSVYKGEVFGLLGPNGAGKTTTFRMLCGLLPASRGELFIDNINVNQAPESARRRLGYVAQKFSLYGPLTVRENLEFFAGAYGIKNKKQRIMEVCQEFELGERLDMAAGALPGGYKQRLAMAVGLLHRPAILFLDEPTSGADPQARRGFWKRISHLADEGITIIITTHLMEEAEYCDRVLIQDSGNMLALDTPANIRNLANPDKNNRQFSMQDAFISIVRQNRASRQ